jgi:signal transduction histidine kinase
MRAQLEKELGFSVDRLAVRTLRVGSLGTGRRLILWFGLIVGFMLAADVFFLWQLHNVRAETMRLTGIQEKLNAIFAVHTSVSALHDRLSELANSDDTVRLLQEIGPLKISVRDQVQRAKSSLMQLPSGVSRDPTIVPTLDDIDITLQEQLEGIRLLALAHDSSAIQLRLDAQVRSLEFTTSDLVAKVDHEVGMEEAQSIDQTRAAEFRTFYETNWFLVLCAAVFLVLLWMTYQWRVLQMQHQFEVTLEARVSERTRIARELHDTLLQSFQGVLLRLAIVSQLLRERPIEAKESLDSTMELAANAITEGRDAIQGMRESTVQENDLARSISSLGEELATNSTGNQPAFNVAVEGATLKLHPILRDEIYRIAGEALRNSFRHAHAHEVQVEIRYDDEQFRLRVRDDGRGIDPAVLARQGSEGHFGLRGMRERATLIGGKLTVWSEVEAGTEVELCVPAELAYTSPRSASWLSRMFPGKTKRDSGESA